MPIGLSRLTDFLIGLLLSFSAVVSLAVPVAATFDGHLGYLPHLSQA